eukprot:CAMPEP_0204838826 /NCGR_PEP_ID=MMETSP1346-20131115/32096_1 /ASSEMBLY_ACC=CAM_ASM_000771 /TAXON_ID=215587 /ORGANISM="Aplanochytrium stocchinoi, Strain GSBS06" /LENGTH=499 /DNA_ID=CAMNT_0051975117 /DNA_START=24 /DNA_END=1523 /DNA_ORIENTATION=+
MESDTLGSEPSTVVDSKVSVSSKRKTVKDLKALIELAQKTFEASASILDQSKRLAKHTNDIATKVRQWKSKFCVVTLEEEKKMEPVFELRNVFNRKLHTFESDMEDALSSTDSLAKIDEIFLNLGQINAPSWMTGIDADQEKKLLDFVDQEAVNQLKSKADGLLKKWKVLVRKDCVSISEEFSQAILVIYETASCVAPTDAGEEFSQGKDEHDDLRAKHSPIFSSARASFHEWIRNIDNWLVDQQKMVEKISSLSRQAASCCDRLLAIQNNDGPQSQEPVNIGKDELWLLNCGDELHKSLKSIASLMQNVNACAKQINNARTFLNNKFIPLLLEKKSLFENTKKEAMDKIETSIQKVRTETRDVLEQLEQLCLFYYEFQQAQDSIRPEILRRWNALAEIEELARKQQEKLNSLVKLEIEMRTEYHREKGGFLPAELCSCLSPSLVHFPTSFQYVVSNPEDAQGLHACISRMNETDQKDNKSDQKFNTTPTQGRSENIST